MGCCGSKEEPKEGKQPVGPEPLRVFGTAFEPATSLGAGVQFYPSAAAFPAVRGQPLRSCVNVTSDEDHVFACLLEGFGGAEAARHLHRFAHELYRSCLGQCGQGQEEEALRATMGQLEQALGPAARTSLGVSASGAGAVIAVINLKRGRVSAACVGGGACVVASTSGSFHQTVTDAVAVADGRKARPHLQAVRAAQRLDSAALSGAAPAHVLGFSAAKSKAAAAAAAGAQAGKQTAGGSPQPDAPGPCPPLECEVGLRTLQPGDDHILLLSSGFLDLLSLQDAALMAHHFHTPDIQTVLDVSRGEGGAANGTPHGAGTAGENTIAPLTRGTRSDRLEELAPSPTFNVSGLLARYAASRPDAASKSHRPRPTQLSDAALISIAVDFPRSMTSRQLSKQTTAAWVRRTLRGASPAVSAGGAPRGSDAGGKAPGEQQAVAAVELQGSRARLAFRWRLVAQYVRFLAQRRRALVLAWRRALRELLAQADVQARQAEMVTWQHMKVAVQVTRLGQVMCPEVSAAGVTAEARPRSTGSATSGGGQAPAVGGAFPPQQRQARASREDVADAGVQGPGGNDSGGGGGGIEDTQVVLSVGGAARPRLPKAPVAPAAAATASPPGARA